MKTKTKSRVGCLLLILFLVLLIVLLSLFREEYALFREETKPEGIAWAPAMKLCKDRYKSLASPGEINIANSKKRTENEREYIFYWNRPVGIFIKKASGGLTINSGVCVVSKDNGEITYMTLNDKTIVGEK